MYLSVTYVRFYFEECLKQQKKKLKHISVTKISQLMVFMKVITVCTYNKLKSANTAWEKNMYQVIEC